MQCSRIHFTLTKTINKLISTKNRVFISLVGPSGTGKLQPIYNWLKNGNFQPKFDKINFFYQHSPTLYGVMQKEIENFEFVQGVNIEFIDSVKNNGTKYLLIFEDSCQEICYSKGLVHIATAGRQNFSTLQVVQSVSHTCKSLFVQSYPKEFIRFLYKIIKSLPNRNLQSIKRHRVAKIQSKFRVLSLERTTWKQKRDILTSDIGLHLIKVNTPPVNNHLS